jgi:hypothetical protein
MIYLGTINFIVVNYHIIIHVYLDAHHHQVHMFSEVIIILD